MNTGRPILILGGTETDEIATFKQQGMEEKERSHFYLLNHNPDAKPDLIADFDERLTALANQQFDVVMMAGIPINTNDIVALDNAKQLLKDNGVFMYFIGSTASDTLCELLRTIFPHVYFIQPCLTTVDNKSIHFYNGCFKEQYAKNHLLDCAVIAFKGKPRLLAELNEIPGFQYALRYIFNRNAHHTIDFPKFSSALERGLGLTRDKEKRNPENLNILEVETALQVFNFTTEKAHSYINELAQPTAELILQLEKVFKSKNVNLKNLAELIVNLSFIAHSFLNPVKPSPRLSNHLLNQLNNPDLKTAVNSYVQAIQTEKSKIAGGLGATPQHPRPPKAGETFSYLELPKDQKLQPLISKENKEGSTSLDYGNRPPQQFPFNRYAAYHARIICYINAAIYAINYDTTVDDRQKKIAALREFAQNKFAELSEFEKTTRGHAVTFRTELYRFYQKLAKISGLKPKQLALAEAFYVWQKTTRPKRITRHVRPLADEQGAACQLVIEQIEIPRPSKLTMAQKRELLRIRNPDNQPHWFKKLPTWAQNALLDIVPKKLGTPDEVPNEWCRYEKCRPSILRQIPGEANATTHQLKITHHSARGEAIDLSSVQRQGVPSSFNMKDKTERETSAAENLKQMLDEQLPEAKTAFTTFWGIDSTTQNIDFPILLGGLITPSEQAGWISRLLDFSGASGDENNTRFARDKELALKKYVEGAIVTPEGDQRKHCVIGRHYNIVYWKDRSGISRDWFFNLNVPLNRKLSLPVAADVDFITFVGNFHQNLSVVLAEQKAGSPEHQARIDRLELIKLAHERLKNLPPPQKDRNRNLYLAGLYDLSTRLMSGLSTGNCKSTKHRKPTEIIMADAILIYLKECQALGKEARIPAYNDGPQERAHFVGIFCELYATAHHLWLAHDNSPGAPGIKDEAVLDPDMIERLQSLRSGFKKFASSSAAKNKLDKKDIDGFYAQSKEIAEANKPGSFWQKFRDRIGKYALITSIVLISLTGIVLMASGVLSPLGLLGIAAAAKLGAAAVATGATINVAVGVAGAVTTVAIALKIGDGLQYYQDEKHTFKAQIERTKLHGVSTAGIARGLELPLLEQQKSSSENDLSPDLVGLINSTRLFSNALDSKPENCTQHSSPKI